MWVIPTRRRCARRAGAIASLAALAAALGCVTPQPPPPAKDPAIYRVGAPDELLVTVLPEPVLTESVLVRPDGMISIQLIGDVVARGRTIDEIAAEIEERIARYKRGPRVSVALAQTASTSVTVLGEVNGVSTFPLVKETRIAELLARVGGTTSRANADEIRVIRVVAGRTQIHEVDLHAIQGGDLRTNIVVEPGDLIYVAPTLLAKIGYAIQAVLFPFQPILGFGQSVLANAVLP